MFSRAHLIIQRQIEEVKNEPGVVIIQPNEKNIFELIALLEGQPKTIWESGIFQICLKFNESYNEVAPEAVYFQTIPYHPNVDMNTGRPSVDFLDEPAKWKPEYSIRHILRSLRHLLAYPLLDRSINMDAVFMLKGNPVQYETIVKHSVLATRKIRQILKESKEATTTDSQNIYIDEKSFPAPSTQSDSNTRFKLFEVNKENKRLVDSQKDRKIDQKTGKESFRNNAISFEDYCQLWKGIATTKTAKDEENIYVKSSLLKNPNLLPQHISISLKELEEHINRQLNEHKNVMYGRFNFANNKISTNSDYSNYSPENAKTNNMGTKTTAAKTTATNYNLLNAEKNRSNKSDSPGMSKHSLEEAAAIAEDDEIDDKIDFLDVDEQEVDELINWTKNI